MGRIGVILGATLTVLKRKKLYIYIYAKTVIPSNVLMSIESIKCECLTKMMHVYAQLLLLPIVSMIQVVYHRTS